MGGFLHMLTVMPTVLFFLLYFVLAIIACACFIGTEYVYSNRVSRIPEFAAWFCVIIMVIMIFVGVFGRWLSHDHGHAVPYLLTLLGALLVVATLVHVWTKDEHGH